MLNVKNLVSLSLGTLAAISGLGSLSTLAIANPQIEIAAARTQRVRVFFPKNPEQQNDLSYVAPVWRQTQNSGVAQFAIAQVIAGPTRQEQRLGFLAPIRLRGTSNCGQDFTLSITSNVANVRFCKQVVSAGVGDDARILSSINKTLKQFPSIKSVVVLDQKGKCFGDMSGENRCLRR